MYSIIGTLTVRAILVVTIAVVVVVEVVGTTTAVSDPGRVDYRFGSSSRVARIVVARRLLEESFASQLARNWEERRLASPGTRSSDDPDEGWSDMLGAWMATRGAKNEMKRYDERMNLSITGHRRNNASTD